MGREDERRNERVMSMHEVVEKLGTQETRCGTESVA